MALLSIVDSSFIDLFNSTVSSLNPVSPGKTFSCTGWKLGWSIGPANLLTCLQTVHQNTVYTCPTPIQEAVAIGFEQEMEKMGTDECYFQSLPMVRSWSYIGDSVPGYCQTDLLGGSE